MKNKMWKINSIIFCGFYYVLILNVFSSVFCDERVSDRLFFTTEENDSILVNDASLVNIHDKNWIVRALYKEDINKTGFAYLEIETNEAVPNLVQALHAGYIEGAVSSKLIYSQWFNAVHDFCKGKEKKCDEIYSFMINNTIWVMKQWNENPDDPYWHQVSLFYTQVSGMYLGYNNHTNNKLDFYSILWLNIYYDILDLYTALGGEQIIGSGSCSVLIKVLPNFKDVYFGHNSWEYYQVMLKILKRYHLNYKKTGKSNEKIPGSDMAFTSYPGTITSLDDFFLISSGLATTETTNQVINKTLWNFVTTENTVWECVRSMVANRLATDGKSWADIFKPYNSGTYNNQWMVFDYKKFNPGNNLSEGAFWVSEQIPSMIIAQDLTAELNRIGYWSSYNIPYYEEIFKISGYDEMLNKYGSWFSHSEAPRARIFQRDQGKVHDMSSFMDLMRSNDYTNEPFARCNCTPPYSAAGAIAARNDLNLANGTYQIQGQSRRPEGATDAKITNFTLFKKQQFVVVAGPTTGTGAKLPVFKWSTSNFTETPHLSHPDTWDFEPVLHKWSFP